MILFGLVWFYGTSITVGYFIPDPVYTYISNIYFMPNPVFIYMYMKYMICKHTLLIHTVK